MKFKDKNILIVGASSGIGRELAEILLLDGANLFTASRTTPVLNGSFTHIDLDVNSTEEQLAILPETLHGVAYCPGTITLKPFSAISLENFRSDLAINVLGAVEILQYCFKRLRKAQGASVVLFSSVAAQQGMSYHTSVALSKNALEGFGRSLAAEWSRNLIRVNTIAPSLTDTPLAAKLISTEEKRAAADQRHPLGRIGKPDDLAQAAAFLLSDKSSWISGQVIPVDGGLSSLRLV